MILQALNELYPRLAADPSYEIAPPGFSPQKISFRLVIRLDGSLVAIEDARTKNTKGAFEPTRLEVPQHEKRTSGVKAQFLCDKAEYLLGRQLEGQRAGFAEECFQACKEKHLTWESEIASPVYSVFCRFLEQWTPIRISEFPIIAQLGANFGVVQILGERGYVHDDVRTREWWTDHLLGSIKRSLSRCLITGDIASPSRIHPDIKGFKSSVALVGIQENTSYESYGWAKTENCPIGESAAFRYSTALNALLDGPQKSKHRINVAGTTTIFWTETPSELEDCFAGVLGQGSNAASDVQDIAQRAKIQRLLNAIRDGTRFQEFRESGAGFYIMGLEQPNPGRLSIRFFHRSTVADLLAKLHDHHRCLGLTGQRTEKAVDGLAEPEFPALWQILDQLPPPKNKKPDREKIPPLLAGALTRAIVEGTPYPEGLYTAIIRRIHADRTINYLRAAVLRAVLVRNHKLTIPTMLDPENTDAAYLHGRLFAVIEKIQEEGFFEQTQRKLEHTIKEKYFSSASATPAAVFPRLETLSVHHQRHLKSGRRAQFDKLVGDIKWNIAGTKKTHTLVEQGRFILGYYHQRKDFFIKKEIPEATGAAA